MSLPATPALPFLLRPARPEDLPALHRFADASGPGITTLPADRDLLAGRLRQSLHAFASEDAASGEEIHLFVVEDLAAGRVIGVSGIAASAGHAGRHYAFRNEFAVYASPALGTSTRIHTLHLCHDLTGVTLLTSFYLEPEYAHTQAAQLLSRARLLFIARFPERFAERIAAEHPGLADASGRCPFWDAVGRRFFGMDFATVEGLAVGRSRAFIGDLMPHSPVYVPLLPEEAQWAIGQLHPDGELPFSILIDEGFDVDTYVDIFDGGPIVQARLANLRSVATARELRVVTAVPHGAATRAAGAPDAPAGCTLVTNGERAGFRATVWPTVAVDGTLELPAAALELLRLGPEDRVWAATLATAVGEHA
jgi:arginine N-succinyltransferase